jgi:hypothetical protein
VQGYDYAPGDQPFLLELWVEKSTMHDVLEPLCRALSVNLMPGAGFQSIASALNLLQRVARFQAAGKPCRVFYVSDFDPAGDQMPVAVARQLEYWRSQYAPGADIKLTPLVLTREQVIAYRLPRTPIKDSDARKGAFEQRHGQGAVELDALESLHPGELARIVRRAVAPYRDRELPGRLTDARLEAELAAEEAYEEATAALRQDLDGLQEEASQIAAEYEQRLREMNGELQERLAPVRERLETVRRAVVSAGEELEVVLPERPEAETPETEEAGWLFDASRGYLEQLRHYQERKAGAHEQCQGEEE